VCFKYRSYFGSIDDGWRAAFPIHQDIISTIPLESMKSASQGLKSQSCSLPMTLQITVERKMLALIIFSFLIGFACLRSGKRALPLEVVQVMR
jgi:Na+/H+-dicarboxylate symporter